MAVAEEEARSLRVASAADEDRARRAAVASYRRIADAAPASAEDDASPTDGLRLGIGVVLTAWALAAAFAWALGVGWASWVMVAAAVAGFALLGG